MLWGYCFIKKTKHFKISDLSELHRISYIFSYETHTLLGSFLGHDKFSGICDIMDIQSLNFLDSICGDVPTIADAYTNRADPKRVES